MSGESPTDATQEQNRMEILLFLVKKVAKNSAEKVEIRFFTTSNIVIKDFFCNFVIDKYHKYAY